ncbi:glycosyltransferase family 2 protein [Phenylobacterium sp.]|jgi:GT2 family glycosyltransferase|uniref:glycosyltransferase family 2 protein n=1 Tax=Phenylobacterium sp. TaxID=1871053 RepID=UPI002E30C4DF|nr:glycosyltransferase family 2 protein [Phenylobacterium sp.]HEX4711353.1 glycosyltransferase family 2 protein [Phenylobacterium sp.]
MALGAAKDNPSSPQVSVVVVVYESGPTLAECLAALRAQTFTDYEILLVDNASSDRTAQAAAKADPAIRLIENAENLGFAAAVNQGARQARGRWLALLNPDAFAEPQWLARLVAAAKANLQVHAFASRQLMAEDPTRLDGLGDVMALAGYPFRGGYTHPNPGGLEPGWVFSACGGAMLIARDLFLRLGGFDERLFCYCEDVDLGYRLRLVGEPTLLVPDAVVRHVGSASSGGRRSDFAVFHGTRNRFWVFVKNTPPVLFWLTLPLHILATLVLFTRHATRGEVATPVRGLLSGIRNIGVALEARREAQASRTASSWAIARAMTWNPLDLLLRRAFIQPRRTTPPGGA